MSHCETREDREREQIRELLEAVHRRYRFDFRDYAYTSIRRRIWNSIRAEGLQAVPELRSKLLEDPDCMERFLRAVTVHVTTMFRDSDFYRAFRANVVPELRSLPFVRIWQAGCSTGQEVYSLAILLEEEDLYDKTLIYSTDISPHVIEQARCGIFPLARLREYTANYQAAGGTRPFSQYYMAKYDNAIFRAALRRNIVFSRHDLAVDGPFQRFHAVLCRNVLIYFNEPLVDRVHRSFYESLEMLGFLALGSRESIRFTPCEASYDEIGSDQRIYRKVR
jgi:chemotaxis protein methyltransferase CheR